jgi:(2Fe-2S) ferredoxin
VGIKPYQRHIIACNGKDCKKAGGGKGLLKALRKLLGKEARYTKCSRVKCLGACKQAPVMIVYPDGVWYRVKNKDVLKQIVTDHLKNGDIPRKHSILVMDDDTASV